ncbi:MAG TPA: ADP-glyceromanno-heptose 6-epimerase, partial [Casimicrobiaceae bacterium]|nr:ADP-glyceromanno-heptose 6-epimerase [Casimicrobiaceae bacterium]
HNGQLMMAQNYRCTKDLVDACQAQGTRLIYASSAAVYGGSAVFREAPEHEQPLNVYGYSKFLFDQSVRRLWSERTAQIAGFRYFNVYGPREQHKGRMASVALHFYEQYRRDGCVRLFQGSGGYPDGEQRRDFIHVDDVVAVNLDFWRHPGRSGVFNLGTGRAATFNDVAVATINACRSAAGDPPRTLAELHQDGVIGYVPMPDALVGKYQSFTQADMTRLRASGYAAPMLAVDQGVARYVESLMSLSESAS